MRRKTSSKTILFKLKIYMALKNTPEFDYNSTRNKLLLSEYGRNVQNMVKYIVALPTKEERNKYARWLLT
jgi:hypothetical protein